MGRPTIWTPADRALVREMWESGVVIDEIAAAVSKSDKTVRNLVGKIGAHRPAGHVRSMRQRADERPPIPTEAKDPLVLLLYRLLFRAVDTLEAMDAPREGPEAKRMHHAIVEEAMRIVRRSPGLCAASDSA